MTRRTLVRVLSFFLATGLVYAVYETALLSPAKKRIVEMQRRIAETEKVARQARAAAGRRSELERERKRLAAELSVLETVVPETAPWEAEIDGLRKLAGDSGLEAAGFTVEARRSFDFYGETLVRFRVSEPSLEQLTELTRRINQGSPLKKVVELELQRGISHVSLGVALFDRG